MLFEPHVFYRCLTPERRALAVANGLAYASWKPGQYPKDSYPRLARALEIDETAVLKACSWGLGQILGENHRAAGFATPQAMVAAFCESEAAQLEGMVAFITARGLDGHLRNHNWAAFARGYNGPAYAKHGYDTKLANALAKWSRIKDTPLGRAAPPPAPPSPDIEPVPSPKPQPKLPPMPPQAKRGLGVLIAGALAAIGVWVADHWYVIPIAGAVGVGGFLFLRWRKRRKSNV